VGQQKSLLLSLPLSSGGISAADIKKTGPSFFIALTKFLLNQVLYGAAVKILS
jgi:hypothetical protein